MPYLQSPWQSGKINYLQEATAYLAARPSCFLVGSSIMKRELVAVEDWAGITAIAKKFVEKIKQLNMTT